MSEPRAHPQILILSDSPKLGRAIELNLRERWPVRVLTPDKSNRAGATRLPPASHACLFILALSSPTSEPLVTLARASLAVYVARHIGRNPLLIISPQPFEPDVARCIWHLGFPFDADELCGRVAEMLGD